MHPFGHLVGGANGFEDPGKQIFQNRIVSGIDDGNVKCEIHVDEVLRWDITLGGQLTKCPNIVGAATLTRQADCFHLERTTHFEDVFHLVDGRVFAEQAADVGPSTHEGP